MKCEQCCEQCGADQSVTSCQACFDALLAYENERPAAFRAVHHLTVACYFLQHPRGYTHEALEMWRSLVADSLDDRATPRELQHRSSQRFEGAKRVRDPKAVRPDWWPTSWLVTVSDVLTPDEAPEVGKYIGRARVWAEHTRARLDAPRR